MSYIHPAGEPIVLDERDGRAIGVARWDTGGQDSAHFGLFARDAGGAWRPVMNTLWNPIRAEKIEEAKALLLRGYFGRRLVELRPDEFSALYASSCGLPRGGAAWDAETGEASHA